MVMSARRFKNSLYVVSTILLLTDASQVAKEEIDKAIEDDITEKLGEDLLQSIERKFQVDLERSVDMVLLKIKLLLQNGTHYIKDRLVDLQGALESIRIYAPVGVDVCLTEKQNETAALAEKALHQMVVCGYALIGQDPSQAVVKVVSLKNMIKQEVKPIYEKKELIYKLIKVCGHEHDSLKKVIKCVISKSPLIKSTMMEITGKLIEGVVELTKMMAHGAMHEACLIEVVKTIEDEAIELVKMVAKCANYTAMSEVDNYILDNNATVLDIPDNRHRENKTSFKDVQELLRRMLEGTSDKELNEEYKNKLLNLQKDLKDDSNSLTNEISKKVE